MTQISHIFLKDMILKGLGNYNVHSLIWDKEGVKYGHIMDVFHTISLMGVKLG